MRTAVLIPLQINGLYLPLEKMKWMNVTKIQKLSSIGHQFHYSWIPLKALAERQAFFYFLHNQIMAINL